MVISMHQKSSVPYFSQKWQWSNGIRQYYCQYQCRKCLLIIILLYLSLQRHFPTTSPKISERMNQNARVWNSGHETGHKHERNGARKRQQPAPFRAPSWKRMMTERHLNMAAAARWLLEFEPLFSMIEQKFGTFREFSWRKISIKESKMWIETATVRMISATEQLQAKNQWRSPLWMSGLWC